MKLNWAKILDNGGEDNSFIMDFEKAFNTPRMNYLNASCMGMVLVERLKWILIFSVSDRSEL